MYPIVTSSGNLILSPMVMNFPPLKQRQMSQISPTISFGYKIDLLRSYYGSVYEVNEKTSDSICILNSFMTPLFKKILLYNVI